MNAIVADVLARSAAAAGFATCFGYLGHHVEPLPQALLRAGCRVVIAASEMGAGYMAQGLALASGRPALAFCCGSPGLSMMFPPLQVARLESIPLLVIVGQTANSGWPEFQDTRSTGSRDRELLAALQIANLHLDAPQKLAEILEASRARLQRSQPVVLTVPCDVMAAPWAGMDPISWWEQSLPLQHSGADPSCIALAGPPEPDRGSLNSDGYRALVVELLDQLPKETLWFGDAGQSRHAMAIELGERGLQLFQSTTVGAMGWALAAAIGAACLEPTRPVCCFSGDGSALMLANEWTTAVKRHLPITFVLAENGVLGQPYSRLQNDGAESLARLPDVDWCALATSLGLPARRVATPRDLAVELAELPAEGPRLLVVPMPARDPAVQPPYTLTGSA
ncbi:MAG: thiamine pyrophosphate-dependent enzyme [Cyanobium sp.]|jgi:thiamine pyrophosphate-dependent acetolactate synthase large subunit-like protein